MSLRQSWIDAIFERLTVRYGSAFMAQYAGIQPEAVKADWALALVGFGDHPESIRYVLENLPEKPINVGQFVAIARRSPPPAVKALPEPAPDPVRVEAALRAARAEVQRDDRSPAQKVIDSVEEFKARKGYITPAQRHVVSHCLRMPGTHTTLGVEVAP
jgi:hypothetical protein